MKKNWLIVRLIIWLSWIAGLTIVALCVWTWLSDGSSVVALKWLQLLQTLSIFLLPPLLTAWICCERPWHWLHLDQGMSWQTALFAIAVMLCALPGINLLSDLNRQMVLPDCLSRFEEMLRSQEDAANQLTESFLQTRSIGGMLLNVLLMALLPALGEELTFRGLLTNFMDKKDSENYQKHALSTRTHIAIWAVAAIFSFVHFQFYGFVPRMLMGAMFGYMLAWTGSLWIPMLMHFTNNAMAVVAYYLTNNGVIAEDTLDTIGCGSTLWAGILSIAIVSCALATYPRLKKYPKEASEAE